MSRIAALLLLLTGLAQLAPARADAPSPADAPVADGLCVEGITPGARITAPTSIRVRLSGEKHIIMLSLDDLYLLFSSSDTARYQLDPARFLSEKRERAAQLKIWIVAAGDTHRTLARAEMPVTLAQPGDLPEHQ